MEKPNRVPYMTTYEILLIRKEGIAARIKRDQADLAETLIAIDAIDKARKGI